jgi:integrase
VRRLGCEVADYGLLSADLAAAGIRREHGVRKLGVRLGNWLSADQAKALWQVPDTQRIKGERDRALLSFLLACGLRRRETTTHGRRHSGGKIFRKEGKNIHSEEAIIEVHMSDLSNVRDTRRET